jgi:spermidine synthase
MVRELLTEDGVIVVAMPGSLSYLSDELRSLNTMAYSTLQAVFPYVRPIPGDLTLWLASPSIELSTSTVDSLVERWEARRLEAQLVTVPHIRLRLDQRHVDWFWTSLEVEEREVNTNRDLHPVGLFYGLSYWNALFSPALVPVFSMVGRLNLGLLVMPLIGCTLLFLGVVKLTGRGQGAIIPVVIATTGFVGMTADLVIILSFQSLYGHVYHWIGLLLTAFMGGLTAGGLLANRRAASVQQDRTTFRWLEVTLVLFWMLMALVLNALYVRITHPALFKPVQVVLFLLNALAGFLVGAQFPLANRLWLRRNESQRGREGALYASDLVGAFLGSILVSVLLIPVLGVLETCLLAGFLKLCSLLLSTTLTPRA